MTDDQPARRMRDPRIPHEDPGQDVSAVVDGELVTFHGLTEVEKLLADVNHDELTRRRIMWGLDRDDWLLPAQELLTDGKRAAARDLLARWCETSLDLAPYDRREPEPIGWVMLADLHHADGDHDEESAVLLRWVAAAPDHPQADRLRDRANGGCRRGR